MADYRLNTVWRMDAALQPAFETLANVPGWKRWWPHLRLSFNPVRCESPDMVTVSLDNHLRGTARVTVMQAEGVTTIQHECQFRTTSWWINMAAPVGRWLFVRRYMTMMRQGAEGLAHHLGARLLDERTVELPPLHTRTGPDFDVAAGIGAGLVAATSSTLVQMGMWSASSFPAWVMLLRDSRLAAAILLGRGVLPPPAPFDWFVMLTASLLHLALSAVYGVVIALLINRLRIKVATLVGAVLGVLLFIINMYGFTAIFPWFVASRDVATAVAHSVFGMTVAACYRYAQPLGIRRDEAERVV